MALVATIATSLRPRRPVRPRSRRRASWPLAGSGDLASPRPGRRPPSRWAGTCFPGEVCIKAPCYSVPPENTCRGGTSRPGAQQTARRGPVAPPPKAARATSSCSHEARRHAAGVTGAPAAGAAPKMMTSPAGTSPPPSAQPRPRGVTPLPSCPNIRSPRSGMTTGLVGGFVVMACAQVGAEAATLDGRGGRRRPRRLSMAEVGVVDDARDR